MKDVIIDMDKLSDSKELYGQKPKWIMAGFIWTILVLVGAALLYSFFGKVEISSKGEGVIRPNEQVSTVSGLVGGQIENVNLADGMTVQEGDVLLVFDYTDMQIDLQNYETAAAEAKHELGMIERYISSINGQKNMFSSAQGGEDYPWYIKYEHFNATLKTQSISFSLDKDTEHLQQYRLNQQLSEQDADIKGLTLLKKSLQTDTNHVAALPKYAYQYELYKATIASIENDREQESNSLKQDATGETRELTLNMYDSRIEGYTMLINSINQQNNLFADKSSMYSLMYEEYAYSLAEAKQAHESAKLKVDLLKSNYNASLAAQANTPTHSELAIAEGEMNNAEKAVSSVKTTALMEAERALAEAQQGKRETEASQELAMDKQEALNRLEETYAQLAEKERINLLLQTEQALETATRQRNANMSELEQLETAIEMTDKSYNNDEPLPVSLLRLQELQTQLETKKALQQQIRELEYSIQKTQQDIEAATIKASRSGTVNTLMDITPGDIIDSGAMVATIIPTEESQYKVQIRVSDTEIAGIKPGNEVKYSVGALPRGQYGTIKGKVLSVSKDTKTMEASSPQKYYIIEATLDGNRAFVDKDGNEAWLAAGMTVEAQIVTQEKRIIFYLLEKINVL